MTINFVDISTLDVASSAWAPKDGVAFRALGYGRVSDESTEYADGTAKSNREQHRAFERWCDANGAVPAWWFDEGARSGSRNRNKRTAFDDAQTVIASGVVDVVHVWSSSRAARDVEVIFNELLPMLRKSGTRYSYGRRVYNPNDAHDREAIITDALRDAAYSARISEDVQRSTMDRARQGAPHGRAPYGYRRVTVDGPNGRTPANEVDPVQAAVVVDTVRRFLAGTSLRSMVDELNANHPLPVSTTKGGRNTGRTIGNGWTRCRVRDMVANPAYAGLRVFRGHIVGEGTWAPLISVADHEAVIARLAATATAKTRGNRRTHLLSGVARCGCGTCDSTVGAGFVQSRDGSKYHTYTCPKGRLVVSEADADRTVIAVLCDGIAKQLRRIDPAKSTEAAELDEAIAGWTLKVSEWTDQMFAGALNESTATAWCNKANAKVAELKAQRDKMAARRVVPTAAYDVADAVDPYRAFKALDLEQRVAVIRSLLAVTVKLSTAKAGVFDAKRLDITWLDDDGMAVPS